MRTSHLLIAEYCSVVRPKSNRCSPPESRPLRAPTRALKVVSRIQRLLERAGAPFNPLPADGRRPCRSAAVVDRRR